MSTFNLTKAYAGLRAENKALKKQNAELLLAIFLAFDEICAENKNQYLIDRLSAAITKTLKCNQP